MKRLQFANGDSMPIFGLGTWKSNPGDVCKAVKSALQTGYRHIDCAPIYGNEAEVGQAIAESIKEGVVSRDELWITSKLWNNSHAVEDVQPALEKTLADLRIEALDLYLIHWPILIKRDLLFHNSGEDLVSIDKIPIAETWKVMEDLADRGLCHHLGVSNFSSAKLQALIKTARLAPEMNQIELHPYLQQPGMLEFCRANNIHLTAYAPLGSADRPDRLKVDGEPILLEDPVINTIAKKHGVSSAQILIAWSIGRNVAVIPKSANPDRIRQNFEAAQISLSAEDMAAIKELDRHRRYVSGTFWTMPGSPYTLETLWDE